jgi:hypothetical protein
MPGKQAHEVIGGDGLVRVLAPACPTCIYGPNSIVAPARRDEVTAANLAADALLTCHHTLPGNSDGMDPAVCAGFWARHWRDVAAGRLAWLIGVTRIRPPRAATTPEDKEQD